jgi:toxin ParE1/3/4
MPWFSKASKTCKRPRHKPSRCCQPPQEDRTRAVVIKWTEQTVRQLDQARDYIALSNSEAVGFQVTKQIVTSVQQLAAFPLSGRASQVSGTRELVIPRTPFIVAYAVNSARIVILAIYHGAQPWPENL